MVKPIKAENPLSLDNVTKSFDGKNVLDGVSLDLEPGTITGLLGRNAAGKTTLIRAAVGLLQIDSGEAKVFGYRSWDSPAAIRRRIGYVSQKYDDMLWHKVGDALKLVASFYETWDQRLVDRFCEEWDVPLDKTISTLSGGQQQKIGIVLAIGHRPDLLILDEPVASLDPVARQEFLRTLLMLNDEIGQTILFSSHITTDIERIAADVAILHEGKITYHGSLDELKEKVQCLFLNANLLDVVRDFSGVVSHRIDGNRLQVWVTDWDEEKNRRLGECLNSSGETSHRLMTESVGLEELFMGMTS
ncbi:MAG: ABC transporter ATP-binding protein [Planctomycetota bacterium]